MPGPAVLGALPSREFRRQDFVEELRSGATTLRVASKKLGFETSGAKSVAIPEVKKFHQGMLPAEVLAAVRDSLSQACKELGLETVATGGDLTFEAVQVDDKKDGTFTPFGTIQPFVEIEVRLKDNRSGETWMLIRDQSRGDGAEDGAFNFADTVIRFLQ